MRLGLWHSCTLTSRRPRHAHCHVRPFQRMLWSVAAIRAPIKQNLALPRVLMEKGQRRNYRKSGTRPALALRAKWYKGIQYNICRTCSCSNSSLCDLFATNYSFWPPRAVNLFKESSPRGIGYLKRSFSTAEKINTTNFERPRDIPTVHQLNVAVSHKSTVWTRRCYTFQTFGARQSLCSSWNAVHLENQSFTFKGCFTANIYLLRWSQQHRFARNVTLQPYYNN